jgi:hypothetical protein
MILWDGKWGKNLVEKDCFDSFDRNFDLSNNLKK